MASEFFLFNFPCFLPDIFQEIGWIFCLCVRLFGVAFSTMFKFISGSYYIRESIKLPLTDCIELRILSVFFLLSNLKVGINLLSRRKLTMLPLNVLRFSVDMLLRAFFNPGYLFQNEIVPLGSITVGQPAISSPAYSVNDVNSCLYDCTENPLLFIYCKLFQCCIC